MLPADHPPQGRFHGREHRLAIRVYYEDTDLSGIVYHANYLRFMERARSDMLRVAGISQREAAEAGEGHYAVRALSIRYLAPARLDDVLVVASRLRAVRAAGVVIHQRVMCGPAALCDAEVEAVFVGPSGRPRRQPASWVDTFNSLI